MPFKPSEFFLTVVTFFGVLVPGAVFVFLLGDRLLWLFDTPAWATGWVVVAVAAYVAGQILLAVTEFLLNGVAGSSAIIFKPLRRDLQFFERKLFKDDPLWPDLPPRADRGTRFHMALSFLRMNKIEAASEIDHMMADYKLLRSLVGVFFIDLIASWIDRPVGGNRILLDATLVVLVFLAFVRVYNWAVLLAFQYCSLHRGERGPAGGAGGAASSTVAQGPASPQP